MTRRLVFTVTRDQFDVETFRVGGNGGQNRDKRDTGVRIRHRASGAVGTAREHRTQGQNRKAAFLRLTKTAAWRTWLARELQRRSGGPAPEEIVDDWMRPENLKVEVRERNAWVTT